MDAQGRVTPEEVRASLRILYRDDTEANLQKVFFHALRDDLKPVNDKGHWKANPLLVLGGFLLIAAFGVFLYFSHTGGGAG
jgi:hypothetical protein